MRFVLIFINILRASRILGVETAPHPVFWPFFVTFLNIDMSMPR